MKRAMLILVVVAGALGALLVLRDRTLPPPPPVAVDAGALEPGPAVATSQAAATPASEQDAGDDDDDSKTFELDVRVVEDETGAALAKARVVWVEDGQVRPWELFSLDASTTDAHGLVKTTLQPRGVLLATAAGHVWSDPVDLDGFDGHEVMLRCHTGRPLHGRVVDAHGRGLPAIRVITNVEFGQVGPERVTWNQVMTDGTGRFESTVVEGDVVVRAGSGPWKVTELHVTAPAPPVHVVLQPGFAFKGEVLEPDGGPSPFATIELAGERAGQADRHGHFEVESLEAASELAAVSDDEHRRAQPRQPPATAAEWTHVTLQLEPTREVSGVVLDEAGKPVPLASLLFEQVQPNEPPLVPLVDDLTRPSNLHADAQGQFSFDTGQVDGRALFEFVGWTAGTQGAVRAHPGQQVELVLHPVPMVVGVVTTTDGRRLEHFRVETTDLEAPQGRFSLPRCLFGSQVTLRAAGFADRVLQLPDAGIDFGLVDLSATHRVRLEPVVTGVPRAFRSEGEPLEPGTEGNRPRVVLVNGEELTPAPDGGLVFEARLPHDTVWVTGRAFQGRQVEVGGTDEVVRVTLQAGVWLVVHPTPPHPEHDGAWLHFEDCVPARAPGETFRPSIPPPHEGWVFAGLSPGHCRLVVERDNLQGTVEVDLPAEAVANVTMAITEGPLPQARGPGIWQIRGERPSRHRSR